MKIKSSGFTLIELMIAVAVVGIIAAIALPSYKEQVNKSRRADGKALLSNMTQQLERCYSKFGRYNSGCSVANNTAQTSEDGYYIVTPTGITATTYSLTAVAQSAQKEDKICADLTLDQTGEKKISGNGSVTECW